MRIGLDFDNTIVCYDPLFHQVALEADLIPPGLPVDKVAVRDHLRRSNKEDLWTEMQGHVYGARMAEAAMFPGVLAFLRWAKAAGCALFIISHKTRHPFHGPRHDLHQAARAWVEQRLIENGASLIPPEHVFFELTKEEKLKRIAACGCDAFVDDLPEILLATGFPDGTDRLLFDPEGHHVADGRLTVIESWKALRHHMATRCQPTP
jgi:hypothetical protein